MLNGTSLNSGLVFGVFRTWRLLFEASCGSETCVDVIVTCELRVPSTSHVWGSTGMDCGELAII